MGGGDDGEGGGVYQIDLLRFWKVLVLDVIIFYIILGKYLYR